jgi:hypothetical protein
MKSRLLITASAAILLAGCDMPGKKTSVVPPVTPKPEVVPAPIPAPPPAPLSTPQTSVTLPQEQPLDEASLETQPIAAPEPAQVAGPPARPRTNRTQQPAAAPAPVAPAPAPDPPRETVQEIISAADKKMLQERAQSRRNEASLTLDRVNKRRLNPTQQGVAASIRNFLTLSEQAEKGNDMRQADALAERAWILAKELQSGR